MKYDLELTTLIDERSAGKSLLEAIAERFSYHSRQYWLERIANRQVCINKGPAAPETILSEGDLLSFTVPDFTEPDIDCNYQVVWRNEYLLLVNKPAGLPVHSTRRFYYQTLVAAIRRNEGFDDINPLQRLDRETSGLMFLSRTSLVPKRFHRNFKKYLQGKYYLGLVRGEVNWQHMRVDEPLKECLTPPVRYKMVVSPEGKTATSDFFCLGKSPDYSLLLIKLETGRKHQIRAHLEYLGHSLIGEKLYFADSLYFLKRCEDNLQENDWAQLGASNHLLHAYAVRTTFPDSGPQTFFGKKFCEEFSRRLERFPGWEKQAEAIIKQN